MKKPVKLADVARAAGVSQGTASNVFSRPELVRPEVRRKVEESARRLGYNGPDPKGRLLRAGKTNAIGVVTMGDLTYFFDDPFNRQFMAGIAEVCDERGAGVSLISAANQTAAAWSIETALVDGFVVQCIEDGNRLIELARKRGLPFVAMDLDPGPGASSIHIDDRGGVRLATEHLVGLGHRRFAILSLELIEDGHVGLVDKARREAARYAESTDRLDGCADALAAAGIDIDDVPVIETLNDRAGVAKGAAMLLDAAPDATAVVAMSDVAALAVLAEAKKRGTDVPGRLSIVGFDDIPEAAASDPPLTTIRQPTKEKGGLAARMVLDGGEPKHVHLPIELVVRGTTGPAPKT